MALPPTSLKPYAEFLAEALEEEREFQRTGEYYEFEDVFRYLHDKIAGKNPRALVPKIMPKSRRR